MHLPYFLILRKNEIYQLNYICIQSNPRKKITGGFIHKFLANYVSLSVLWDMTLTIYQHICLHSHFTSYKFWERVFFLMMLHCLHFLVYLRGRWFYLCDESNPTSECHGNEKFQSCTNIPCLCWAPGCELRAGEALGSSCSSFVQFAERTSATCSVLCDSVGSRGIHPSTPVTLCKSEYLAETTTGAVPQRALANRNIVPRSGFSWLGSIWTVGSELICSSWELRYKSVPIVPFCNMQIIMSICIFLHFCVWYMYYLRQML